uniref:DNA-directed RNA polymerase subunit beta' n=1 Tax=Bracteacoccus minor TaxID=50037 RepID=A0A140HAL9_9CHLO|nr:beta subunit of RNA polymerase [Bracteacoccus minor]AMO01218.1 beta subunit of RNA polymerase [Bracteacoccus minor]
MNENRIKKNENFLSDENEVYDASNQTQFSSHAVSFESRLFRSKDILKNQSQKNRPKSQNIKLYSSPFISRINLLQKKQNSEIMDEKQHKHSVSKENRTKNSQIDSEKQNLYASYSKFHELKLISIGLASAEMIRRWAEKTLPNGKILGQVNTANTLHHKTFKPQKGGLFCERIFGPLKDFECACGQTQRPNDDEYKKLLYRQYDSNLPLNQVSPYSFVSKNAFFEATTQGPKTNVRPQTARKFCPNCDVEYTWSIIRRYQMGYIQLVSPVSHLWYLKANPSYLSLLLDMKRRNLENVIYCSETMTLENTWKSTQNFGMSLGTECSPTVLFSTWKQLVAEERAYRESKLDKKMMWDTTEALKRAYKDFNREGEKKGKSLAQSETMDFFDDNNSQKTDEINRVVKKKTVDWASNKKRYTYITKKMNLRKRFFLKTQRFSISMKLEKTEINTEKQQTADETWRNIEWVSNAFERITNPFDSKNTSLSRSAKNQLKTTPRLNLFGFENQRKRLLTHTPDSFDSNINAIHLSNINFLKQKVRPIEKIIKSVENQNKDVFDNDKNNYSLKTLYLFDSTLNKIATPSESNFDKKNFHLILQSIWKKFYKVVYRSAQLKSSTILYKTKIEACTKTKNKKRNCFNDDLIFLRRIESPRRNSEYHSFSSRDFVSKSDSNGLAIQSIIRSRKKVDFLKNRLHTAVYKIDLPAKNQMAHIKRAIKFYIDSKTTNISEISLWSLLSFFNNIELTDLKWITDKKNVSLINLIVNLDKPSAFFRVYEQNLSNVENHEKNTPDSKKYEFHLDYASNRKNSIASSKQNRKKEFLAHALDSSNRKNSTSLKTLIYLIKSSFRLHLIYCVQNRERKLVENQKDTFSFMSSMSNEWFKNTKLLIHFLVDKLTGFLVKYRLQKKFSVEFVIYNELEFMNENVIHIPKIYCLPKAALSNNYLTNSEPRSGSMMSLKIKKINRLHFEKCIFQTHPIQRINSLNTKEIVSPFDPLVTKKITARLNEASKTELSTSSLFSKLLTFLKQNILLAHLNEVFLTNDANKKKGSILLNINAFNEMQKIFMSQQQVIMKKIASPSDSSIFIDDQITHQSHIKNKIITSPSGDSPISRDHSFNTNGLAIFLLHYCGLMRLMNLSSKEWIVSPYDANSFQIYDLKQKYPEKLETKKKLSGGVKNKEIFYTYGPLSSNIWNQTKHKNLLSSLYSVSSPLSEHKKSNMNFSSRVAGSNQSDKKNMRRASKITHRYNLVKKEFAYVVENQNRNALDSKNHIIFNNVYCLSHRYCWNLERNWQYFYYYNSSQGDFDDSIIPRYKCRIVGGTTSNDINLDNTIAGAGIIQKLLSELNPKELRKMDKQNRILLYELNKKISKLKNLAKKGLAEKIEKKQLKQWCEKRDQLIRRTKLVRKLFRKNSNPDSMILTALPVLPPDLRPILKMQDQIAASDLNRLYQRVIYRNDRLRKFLKDPAISNSFEMKYAQRLLQEAVDNLIQNGKGGVAPEKDSRGRALKSLSEILKGKQGRFRQYLLGKRVDYSGRSVIVVGPRLKLHECGLPKEMARELFLPFLIKRILHYKLARTVIGAKTIIKTNEILTDQLLREILQSHPILLNRAPTLHRLGIQAFQPLLIEGRAILLHPLVCPAFNADFDGDQMAVHVPLTVEARSEAWKLMFSRNNLISPATGEPIMLPSQDMVLGCYYLTTEISQKMRDQWLEICSSRQNQAQTALAFANQRDSELNAFANQRLANRNSEKMPLFSQSMLAFCFSNFDQVMIAYQQKQIDVHTSIWVVWNNSLEVANEISQPLEIRLNLQGYWQEIRFKSFCRFDCTGFKLNRLIRTTAGRVLLNKIFYSCIK